MIVWIVGIFFLILVILLGIAVYTDSKESNKYPCIENEIGGYYIKDNKGEIKYLHYTKYKTIPDSISWYPFAPSKAFKTLEEAVEIFDELFENGVLIDKSKLGRVYGLENIAQKKEIQSKTALLEEIIAVDKKNGENTDVLESILIRQKEELLA